MKSLRIGVASIIFATAALVASSAPCADEREAPLCPAKSSTTRASRCPTLPSLR